MGDLRQDQWPPLEQQLPLHSSGARGEAPARLLRGVEVLALQGNYALQEEVLAAPKPRLREVSLVGCGVVSAETGEGEFRTQAQPRLAHALRQLCSGSPALCHVDGCYSFVREAAEAIAPQAVLPQEAETGACCSRLRACAWVRSCSRATQRTRIARRCGGGSRSAGRAR